MSPAYASACSVRGKTQVCIFFATTIFGVVTAITYVGIFSDILGSHESGHALGKASAWIQIIFEL